MFSKAVNPEVTTRDRVSFALGFETLYATITGAYNSAVGEGSAFQ
jgi:hypothetical protein